jgi:hypothetical protein
VNCEFNRIRIRRKSFVCDRILIQLNTTRRNLSYLGTRGKPKLRSHKSAHGLHPICPASDLNSLNLACPKYAFVQGKTFWDSSFGAGAVIQHGQRKNKCLNFIGISINDSKISRKLLICRSFHKNDSIEKTFANNFCDTSYFANNFCDTNYFANNNLGRSVLL